MMLDTLLLTHRTDSAELLDEGTVSAAAAHASLRDLRWLNRWVFGVSATLHPLRDWLRAAPKPATVLDLGTGSGQMAQYLAQWAMREHQAVRVLALDFSPRHLAYAQAWNRRAQTPHVHLLGGDALRLPLADSSVDYVTSSLFLHHFAPPQLEQLLAECRRVARRGLAMSDLWRHPLPFYLYRTLIEPLLVRSPVTRHDGRASFHRAYRPAEVEAIAARVLPDVAVQLHLPGMRWRLLSRWG